MQDKSIDNYISKCDICGRILKVKDERHKTSFNGERITYCHAVCKKETALLNTRLIRAIKKLENMSIEQYHESVRENTIFFLDTEIDRLKFKERKSAIKFRALIARKQRK